MKQVTYQNYALLEKAAKKLTQEIKTGKGCFYFKVIENNICKQIHVFYR